MTQLALNHNLIVNRADKGFTIVVRHRIDYIREGLEHLSNTNTYLELDKDYTNDVTKIVTKTLQPQKDYYPQG